MFRSSFSALAHCRPLVEFINKSPSKSHPASSLRRWREPASRLHACWMTAESTCLVSVVDARRPPHKG